MKSRTTEKSKGTWFHSKIVLWTTTTSAEEEGTSEAEKSWSSSKAT